MLCKAENRDPAHCLQEGRRVTRCAQDLYVPANFPFLFPPSLTPSSHTARFRETDIRPPPFAACEQDHKASGELPV